MSIRGLINYLPSVNGDLTFFVRTFSLAYWVVLFHDFSL